MRFDEIKDLSWVEAIDVENGEYNGWDALGRALRMTASGIGLFKLGEMDMNLAGLVLEETEFAGIRARAEKR